MIQIPSAYLDILNKASLAHVATVDSDGTPQVTPVWIDYDGQYLLMNSAKGRKKDRNLVERPQIGFSIVDKDNPYRYIGIQGRVVEITEAGAVAHIHKLSNKYTGKDYSNLNPAETRLIYKIEPSRIWAHG